MDTPQTTSTEPSTAIVNTTMGTEGFYTDYPRQPQPEETNFISPDRKSLIVGCALGTVMFLSLLIAAFITIKMRRKRIQAKKAEFNQYAQDWRPAATAEKYQHSAISHEYIHHNVGHVNNANNFSLMNPHSPFSMAVKKASEIPSSPTSLEKQ